MTNGATFENGGFLRGDLEGVRLLLPLSSIHPELVVRQEGRCGLTLTVRESNRARHRAGVHQAQLKILMKTLYRDHLIEIWGDRERTQRLLLDLNQRKTDRHRLRIAPRQRQRDR